ncbi:MAG: flagellar assembly peptidoglycan hydrolase FlgJ, partial [Pseudomonadales bacterium]|nr:flagellar assembly peptidoglycan hydrolase FlgJ [Pseudomonadales bacterium]
MTASATGAGNVNDFAALTALRKDARAQTPESLREAARQFESLFTKMMLDSMRKSSMGDELFGSDQADFYQGMFDDQLAVELSRGRGLGLADMLIEQLTRAGLVTPQASESADPTAGIAVTPSDTPANRLPLPDDQLSRIGGRSPVTRNDFVRELWPHAEAAGRELGVDPRLLIAHAALETGWGRSLPADADGRVSFNMFGIKATGKWQGAAVGSRTLEFDGGVAVARTERFRAYDSPADSFQDYVALLRGNVRYQQVLGTGADARAFARGLQAAGYATDPDYAKKLTAVAAQLGLA